MIAGLLKDGKIVPNHITIELLKQAIDLHQGVKVFLIDGFPRTIEQGDIFEKDVIPCKFLLSLEAPDTVLIERLLSRAKDSNEARSDDNIETIKKRLVVHHTICEPVIDHYAKKEKLRRVDANRPVDAVYNDIKNLLIELKL